MYYSSLGSLRSALAGAEFEAALARNDAATAYRTAAAARARAADFGVASAIQSGSADAHAEINRDLNRRLLAVSADRDRLQDRCDMLEIERGDLIAHCASLLAEMGSFGGQ